MISRAVINRPIIVLVLFLVVVLGVVVVILLFSTRTAEIAPPVVTVSCSYPGADAKMVAETVAAPIEEQVNGVEGMMKMSSECSNDGDYRLTVIFAQYVDPNLAKVLVENRIDQALPQLANRVRRPTVAVTSPNMPPPLKKVVPDRRSHHPELSHFEETTDMHYLVELLAYRYVFVLWGVLFLLTLRLHPTPGKKFLAAGIFLFVLAGMSGWLGDKRLLSRDTVSDLRPWCVLGGLACLCVGVTRLTRSGAASASQAADRINTYYTTDELISRCASTPTANEDLRAIKQQWNNALLRFVKAVPEQTGLSSTDKYRHTLLLERYIERGTFAGSPCGQLRSVQLSFFGPGDALPWMSVQIEYAVDQVVVGTFTISNEEVIEARNDPTRLHEFKRIARFLDSGTVRARFFREGGGAGLLMLGKGIVLFPVAVPVFLAGVAFAPLRRLFLGGQATSRFVTTRRPDTLPPEQSGVPVAYWNALLPNLAEIHKEVLEEVRAALQARAESGVKTYQADIVQWGGYSLKEVRQQTVLEYRRAKVYLSVYSYGNDLYARWDSHVNRRTWSLRKFPYAMAVGYRFRKSWLSWAVPLFVPTPDVYEFAPADSAITDYDWADVDALQDLAHEILTSVVRKLKERYHVEKEIDFKMKEGQRSDRAAEAGAAGAAAPRPTAMAKLFSRRLQ